MLDEGLSKGKEHFVSIHEMAVLGKSPAQGILSVPNYMDGTAQKTTQIPTYFREVSRPFHVERSSSKKKLR